MGRKVYTTICFALAIMWFAALPARADDEAVKNLKLVLEGACDPKNSRLFVENKHGARTIIATVRWNLSGSKRIATDLFQVGPNSRVEIGCAAQADVVTAEFSQ